jgi:hypothetical protein
LSLLVVDAAAAVVGLEPQAVISPAAAADALNRPTPDSSLRRVGLSFMFSVSIASSTFGSTSFIGNLQLFPSSGVLPTPLRDCQGAAPR